MRSSLRAKGWILHAGSVVTGSVVTAVRQGHRLAAALLQAGSVPAACIQQLMEFGRSQEESTLEVIIDAMRGRLALASQH